jgi:hypothetical protein
MQDSKATLASFKKEKGEPTKTHLFLGTDLNYKPFFSAFFSRSNFSNRS